MKFEESSINTFKNHVTFKKNDILSFDPNSSTLYTISYFPECLQEYENPNDYIHFEVDWDNEKFRKEIQGLIKSKLPLEKMNLPNDRITLAVHVRKRVPEFDGPVLFEQKSPATARWSDYADRRIPFKFATDDYYQEQIKRVSAFFGHQPMYVYLFTDSPNPTELLQQYAQAVQLPNIEFDCRRTTNKHDLNVLEDFFALTQFDCLIRVDSNFSLIASRLAKYKIVATPKGYHFHPIMGYAVIDQVTFTLRQ